jgi:hypothetical protein
MPSTLSCECTARTLFSGNSILRYHEAGYGPPLVFLHGNGPGVTGWADYAFRHPRSVHRLVIVGGIGRNVLGSGKPTHDRLVKTPTLMVWGRDDPVTPLDMAIATMSGFPLQRDEPECRSGADDFGSCAINGSAMATAARGGCTGRPAVQYVMGQ